MNKVENQVEPKPVHEVIIEMLEDDDEAPFPALTLARIYINGGLVPQDGIDVLAMAFENTMTQYSRYLSIEESLLIGKAVETIRRQKPSKEDQVHVHKVVIEMLEDREEGSSHAPTAPTLARIYINGGLVPQDGIDDLIRAFKNAMIELSSSYLTSNGSLLMGVAVNTIMGQRLGNKIETSMSRQ